MCRPYPCLSHQRWGNCSSCLQDELETANNELARLRGELERMTKDRDAHEVSAMHIATALEKCDADNADLRTALTLLVNAGRKLRAATDKVDTVRGWGVILGDAKRNWDDIANPIIAELRKEGEHV